MMIRLRGGKQERLLIGRQHVNRICASRMRYEPVRTEPWPLRRRYQ